MSMKIKHKVTGSTKWMIYTAYPAEEKNRWRTACVYRVGARYVANLSGARAVLEPVYDAKYHDGAVPLHFEVKSWEMT